MRPGEKCAQPITTVFFANLLHVVSPLLRIRIRTYVSISFSFLTQLLSFHSRR